MKTLLYGEKHSFIEWTYVVGDIGIASMIASMKQFQWVPTTHVTEIKETNFEICTKQVAFLF